MWKVCGGHGAWRGPQAYKSSRTGLWVKTPPLSCRDPSRMGQLGSGLQGTQPSWLGHSRGCCPMPGHKAEPWGDPSSRNNGATPRTRQGHKGQLQARRQHQAPPLRAVDTHHTHEDEPMGCPLTLTKWPLGHKQASPQAGTQETTVGGGPAGPLTPPQGGREATLASRCWSSGLRAPSTQKDDQLGPHALQPGASLPPR